MGENLVVLGITNYKDGFDVDGIVRDWKAKGLDKSTDFLGDLPTVVEFSSGGPSGDDWKFSLQHWR